MKKLIQSHIIRVLENFNTFNVSDNQYKTLTMDTTMSDMTSVQFSDLDGPLKMFIIGKVFEMNETGASLNNARNVLLTCKDFYEAFKGLLPEVIIPILGECHLAVKRELAEALTTETAITSYESVIMQYEQNVHAFEDTYMNDAGRMNQNALENAEIVAFALNELEGIPTPSREFPAGFNRERLVRSFLAHQTNDYHRDVNRPNAAEEPDSPAFVRGLKNEIAVKRAQVTKQLAENELLMRYFTGRFYIVRDKTRAFRGVWNRALNFNGDI